MKYKKLKMKLNDDSYPIIIGDKVLTQIAAHIPNKTSKIILISDERLDKKRKELLKILKTLPHDVVEIPVQAGENLKSIKTIYPLYGKLLEARADRDSLLIALGGGSIGDAAGFIAATYMRGIKWIGLPTTLLAQVDSSVGGKTGINHETGKNLIGAFHQPSLVLCEVGLLKSLGPREKISGIGEIIKYSLTFDKGFFKWLEENLQLLLKGSPEAFTHAIKKSLEWKCYSVSQDVYDRLGAREILNFGHTFGHALESATKYKEFQHGEAVIWGMRFAVALSEIRGKLSRKKAQRIDDLLSSLDVPEIPKSLKRDDILIHMKRDKKSQGNSIRFVLLDDIGHSISDSSVTKEDLNKAYLSITQKRGPHERK